MSYCSWTNAAGISNAAAPRSQTKDSAPFYRSLRATRQWERDQAEALSEHLWDLVWTLEREFELPRVALPDMEYVPAGAPRGRLERAAAELRAAWGVPAGPIANVVRLLEAHGILVARLSGGSPRMDARSRAGSTPDRSCCSGT